MGTGGKPAPHFRSGAGGDARAVPAIADFLPEMPMRNATRWTLCALLLCSAATAGRAEAQQPGDTVRVTVENGPRTAGRLERIDADTLVLVGRDSVRRAVPRGQVRRLEVAHGRTSPARSILRSAAFGAVIGAAAGATVGALTYSDECDASSSLCLDLGRGFDAYIGGFVGGVAGALGGGLIGAARDRTEWVRVPGQSGVSVGVGSGAEGGVAVGAALRLR